MPRARATCAAIRGFWFTYKHSIDPANFAVYSFKKQRLFVDAANKADSSVLCGIFDFLHLYVLDGLAKLYDFSAYYVTGQFVNTEARLLNVLNDTK